MFLGTILSLVLGVAFERVSVTNLEMAPCQRLLVIYGVLENRHVLRSEVLDNLGWLKVNIRLIVRYLGRVAELLTLDVSKEYHSIIQLCIYLVHLIFCEVVESWLVAIFFV